MKTSIYSKIRKGTSFISVISLLCVGIAAFSGIAYMRQSVTHTSEELGNSAAHDSKQALSAQAEETLSRLAKSKAELSDEKLSAVSEFVCMISQTSTEIMSNPENYAERDVGFPDPANENVIVSQLRLPVAVSVDDVADEISLIANIQDLLLAIKKNSESVSTVYIGTEKGVSISTDGDSAIKTNVYDPRVRPWYMTAKENDSLIWTDVFDDNSGRGLAITCAAPFYGADGEMRGVAGIGMILINLSDVVVKTKIGETGHAFIVNEKAEIIIADNIRKDEKGAIIRENLLESRNYPHETVENMISGGSGIERVTVDGTEYFLAYEPLSSLPWSLAILMGVDEVIEPALISERNIIVLKDDAMDSIDVLILLFAAVFGLIIAAVAAVNFIMAKRLAGSLAGPIIELSRGAEIISSGNLEHRLDAKTDDEVETLANTFNAMIDNIKTITADRERIGAELSVATNIQASMLPCIFPAFPDRPEFDIYASMQPAKEVGGDFYDFFLVDEKTLAVIMADVSGKGVPAALFMVIAKTLIKNNAQYGKSPKEVFEAVNNLLCENNDAGMFVTAFMGYLDIPSGKFTFVNAGHNPPLLRTGARFEWLKASIGFVLAGMEDMFYKQGEITLRPGDDLFLYTDGVTEAVNNEKELFSDPLLLETANNYLNLPLKEFTVSIKREIDKFAEGAEQADDITMLALRYKGLEEK